jgi:hypothetical protein
VAKWSSVAKGIAIAVLSGPYAWSCITADGYHAGVVWLCTSVVGGLASVWLLVLCTHDSSTATTEVLVRSAAYSLRACQEMP